MSLSDKQRELLLNVARESIAHGLSERCALPVEAVAYESRLREVQASFVTLHLEHRLRGCMGGLEAWQPVVQDVSQHAFMAAFSDHRFVPLTPDEFPHVRLHLSLLSPHAALEFAGETELAGGLRPGIDGLLIAWQGHRATFLPSVWGHLPEPRQFILELKRKAGIPEECEDYCAWRYTTESFEDTGA